GGRRRGAGYKNHEHAAVAGRAGAGSAETTLIRARSRERRGMHYTMWRGVAGLVKPTRRPGSLETLIRLLPEGIGVVPLLLNVRQGDHQEFSSAIPLYEKHVA